MRIKSLSYLLISSIFIKSIHAKNQCEILYDIINEITDSIQDFTKVSDVNMDCCDLDFIGCADEDGSKIITNIELNGERFKFVNQIPESLTNLSNLERIGITKVNNGGIKIPDFLSKLKNLNTLELMENYLEKDFPDAVIKISSLKTLYIKNNNIGGNIPESIDELSELEYLYIRNNLIKGKIPKSIGNLKNIKEIHLDNNLLEGEIPKSIGDLTHIKKLHLNGNKLTEKIPESIGELENLESLDLSENSLTGLIPDSIENLKKLKYLNLSKNKLNDVIDFSGNLPELSKIFIREWFIWYYSKLSRLGNFL
ncbi:L domain-like protein [Piromyces finnis]|uniref:L domain-like protein n=1 Tax=Piromyces finnis TaxID=1754191 RepID=A0A1Y1VNP2_9FUNG|nr:L domain-like protein [Piromyces finnis]|eukprot:ORX60763.1 L domain-like protein [Piromyces finnis]